MRRLRQLVDAGGLAVLTGAGCSTESGIPDYRGAHRRSPPPVPMQWQEFTSSAGAQRRYWARSFAGWQLMAAARADAAHLGLATLQAAGKLLPPITQNVDGLHTAAGSNDVIELHGCVHRVVCLDCQRTASRIEVQEHMRLRNQEWSVNAAQMRPDGDLDLDDESELAFVVPTCQHCGGRLKPDVVFFGENVPVQRVTRATDRLRQSAGLLVLGSSLTVFSGYRFARSAAQMGQPVIVVNLGPTRADDLAELHVHARCGDVMSELAG